MLKSLFHYQWVMIQSDLKNLAIEEESKNIYFIGRLANYTYFNMDQAILNSLEFFDKVLFKKYNN